jgi:hypothetical protein
VAAQRTIAQRAIRQESEVLLLQLNSYLSALRSGRRAADLDHAERMAAALRQLIADTARSSAVDRARVRAAVHYFVARGAGCGLAAHARYGGARYALLTGGRAERRLPRTPSDDDRVVNDLLRELGRPDLVISD